MKNKIDKPKVFISYAWGTEENQQNVLAFAERLIGDGIDVLLDKWELDEGNFTYQYMEQSVNDETISNVLMLLDPEYTLKANEKRGGAGVEAQIISADLYNKTKQTKYLPIIFSRDASGNVCKPTFLTGTLHFDFTDSETYEIQYQKLVKGLFGVEIYTKPEIGRKPSWVESTTRISLATKVQYNSLVKNIPEKIKKVDLKKYLNDIAKNIIEKDISDVMVDRRIVNSEYIKAYREFEDMRDVYLELLSKAQYVENNERIIADFLEELYKLIYQLGSEFDDNQLRKTLLHEMFIYTIAGYYKKKDYSALGYILGKSYIKYNKYHIVASSYHMFYNTTFGYLDNAINERDGQSFITGTAKFWVDNINVNFCTKEEFVFADILCHNYFLFGNGIIEKDYGTWFSKSYIYNNEYVSEIKAMSIKLASNEYLTDVINIFNYENINEFVNHVKLIANKIFANEIKRSGYSYEFYDIPLISDYIKIEAMGTLR